MNKVKGDMSAVPPPIYAPPPGLPPSRATPSEQVRGHAIVKDNRAPHTNPIIEAGKLRARDEQDMQNLLQQLQFQYRIYNSEIEPEHDSDYPCSCPIHQYQRAKWSRSRVQDMWNAAVLYPGEKAYNGNQPYGSGITFRNPYQYRVTTPYGPFAGGGFYGPKIPSPMFHAKWTTQTIALNNSLNHKAQTDIDAREPKVDIWHDRSLESAVGGLTITGENDKDGSSALDGDSKLRNLNEYGDVKGQSEKGEKRDSSKDVGDPSIGLSTGNPSSSSSSSRFSKFRSSLGIKSSEERQVSKVAKMFDKAQILKDSIISEEQSRWRDEQSQYIVQVYQEKTGMAKKIADLRKRQPIQYLHLLRAGYFEPIPVAWANQASNPLKFTIEPAAGWRGVTPAWRGYEDTAEERLYWVLNHREGVAGTRLKPDFISALDLARERMARAVPPPPEYYDANDTCHVEKTSEGYSKQVMPAPFKAYDRPETATDDTMILLDVSGSMDFEPQSPIYDRYLITGYRSSTQPRNKDLAKAIIRRFTDAMINHDHTFTGYDLTTFSSQAAYIGSVRHDNFESLWRSIKIGGGTRVMTGWQKVKDLHFQKHSESAIHHPVFGWQAGPNTPMLRLLLLLDGEATDMDEFELDLLGLSWAHVTIFLIGVDGCPHHHRHANELQRISDVNHHVSFVDAQGNTPERFVTHELLKRHLGYDVSLAEFKDMELPPTYEEANQ